VLGWRGDDAPTIQIPREAYGGAQGLAEAFGCELRHESGGHWWAVPALDRPEAVRTLKINGDWLSQGFVGKGLDAFRSAREAASDGSPIQQPVTAGIIDTASLVLGYQPLMEALYSHPDDVHALLRVVTDVLVEYIAACREAAGELTSEIPTVRDSYTMSSEVRAVLSEEHFEEFEQRYLNMLSDAIGPINIHSCGDWARHVPAMVRGGRCRAVDFGLPEMDWPRAAEAIGDSFWIHAHRSANTGETFGSWEDFFYHYGAHMRPESRVILSIYAENAEGYNAAWDRLEEEGRLAPQLAEMGRVDKEGGKR
jgi:hypothetical protein